MLKLRLHHDARHWGDPINVVSLADGLGVSRTPVREALFRFIGEGIVEPAEQGGFRLCRPDAGQLTDVYEWQMQMVLTAIHLLKREWISEAITQLGRGLAVSPLRSPALLAPAFFQMLADAVGNREISRQMQIANDRLVLVREAEETAVPDQEGEVRRFLQIDDSDVKKITRRRSSAYFLRRISRVQIICRAAA